jgi:TP901 family phage tail tape measure protein
VARKVGTAQVDVEATPGSFEKSLLALAPGLLGRMGSIGGLAGKALSGATESGMTGLVGKVTGLGSAVGGPYGIAVAAGVTAAVGIGTALFKVGEQFETAYRTIAQRTGATGATLKGLDQTFRDTASHTGASFGNITEALVGFHQKLDLTGKPLENVSLEVLKLARVTGTDVQSNVEAIGRLLNNWNMPASQAAGVMDKLLVASQKTGVGIGQLEEATTKYGPAMRQLGYSFDQSTALIATFEKEGVNTQAVMMGMNRAVATMAKASGDSGTAMKGLTKATDSAGASDSALAKAKQHLADMEARLGVQHQAATVSTNSVTVAQQRLTAAQERLSIIQQGLAGKSKLTTSEQLQLQNAQNAVTVATTAVSNAHQTYQQRLDQVAAKSGLSIAQQQALRQAQDAVAAATDKAAAAHGRMATAQGLSGKAAEAFPAQFKAALDSIKNTGDATQATAEAVKLFGARAGPQMAEDIRSGKLSIDQLTGALANSRGAVDKTASSTATFHQTLAKFGNQAKVAFEPLATKVFDTLNTSLKALGPTLTLVAQLIGYLIKPVLLMLDALTKLIAFVTDIFQGKWGKAWADIKSVIWDFVQYMYLVPIMLAETFGPEILKVFSKIGEDIGNFFVHLWDSIYKWGARTLHQFWQGIVDTAHEVADWFTDLPHKILDWLSDLPSKMLDLGKKIIEGIVHGITGSAGDVGNAIKDAVVHAPGNLIKSALSIFSPSRVYAEYGRQMMLGLIQGINEIKPAVGKALPTNLNVNASSTGGANVGPALVIQNATFNNEADLETLNRKLDFAISAQIRGG